MKEWLKNLGTKILDVGTAIVTTVITAATPIVEALLLKVLRINKG